MTATYLVFGSFLIVLFFMVGLLSDGVPENI